MTRKLHYNIVSVVAVAEQPPGATAAGGPLSQAPQSPGNAWAQHRCSGVSLIQLRPRTAEVNSVSAVGWKLPAQVLRAAPTAADNHGKTLLASTFGWLCRALRAGGFHVMRQRRGGVPRGPLAGPKNGHRCVSARGVCGPVTSTTIGATMCRG